MKPPAFGLIAQLSKSRVTLPLIHIETRFRVTGEFAAVEMDQVFEQTARESLDVTYTFPLPGSAAVYRCEMIVNDRLIRAKVMEEQEARRVVAEQKAAGHRTALVEMDRENLFTLQLGNTAPGDRIVIRFAYFENLDRLGPQLSLRLPFSPGIRYIPGKPLLRKNRGLGWADDTDQVPDASRLSPPRIRDDHPDAATLFLHGALDADEVALSSLSSPTHPALIRPRDSLIEVELCGEEHLPDRDFVLRWEETAAHDSAKPKAWISDHTGPDGDTHRYAILQLRAPQADAIQADDHFAQDIYFLLDRSGSMYGEKWEKCAEALHAFVRELGSNDRVWITCFESEFQDFAEAPMPRDEILADTGFQTLAQIGTAGGTELLPALEHVLKARAQHSGERPARLILITDGQVGNEHEILRLMRRPYHTGLPLHTFGIDTAVNDAFLKNLAHQTGGRCALMTPADDIPAAVQKLAVTLRRPVLTGLKLDETHFTPNDSCALPDLHAGEVLLVPIRSQPSPPASKHPTRLNTLDRMMPHILCVPAEVTGVLPDGSPWSIKFEMRKASEDAENPIPRLLWAHRRCRHLLDTHRQAEAIQLATAHNLPCRGASFVAWDEAEKVPVAKREVYQPSLDYARKMIPAGAALGDMLCAKISAADFECESLCETTKDTRKFRPVYRRTFSGPRPPSWFSHDSSDLLTDHQEKVFLKMLIKYGGALPKENKTTALLGSWAHRFAKLLIARLKVHSHIAFMIVVILRHWGIRASQAKREQQLETLLTELETAPDPAALLTSHLTAKTRSRPHADAIKLLTLALPSAPSTQTNH